MMDAMIHNRFDHSFTFSEQLLDIQSLNEAALRSSFDISKISVATYPLIQDQYEILDAGAALGFGCGPIIVSQPNFDVQYIEQATVAIPGQHTTAHYLFNHFFKTVKEKRFKVFSEIEPAVSSGEVELGVLIHEGRFTYQQKGLALVADLGQMWENAYQLPIPLGMLVCKRSIPEDLKQAIKMAIKQSIQYAFDHPSASSVYILEHAQEMDQIVIQQHIDLYVNRFSLSLGDIGRQAIDFLFSKN